MDSDSIVKSVPVTVIVLAKNEADTIERCLASVQACQELIVVDDYSQDETASIARRVGAHVVVHAFQSFASQRNWAIENLDLACDWVLMLDADEAATPEMLAEVAAALRRTDPAVSAYRTCRKTIFFGKWLRFSDGFPVWIMRLVHRNRARFEDSGHGEVPVPKVAGEIGTIREPFLHFPFSRGLADWFERHNRYSTREARLEMEMPKVPWRDLFTFDSASRRRALRGISRKLPCRPLLRFLYQFIWKFGFLDGPTGYVFCRMMAAYERQIVLKVWEITRQRSEIKP
jgi:glycosyltransferase involved in cell wall biosynthesis